MEKQQELLEQAINAFQKNTGLVVVAHSHSALIIAQYHLKNNTNFKNKTILKSPDNLTTTDR